MTTLSLEENNEPQIQIFLDKDRIFSGFVKEAIRMTDKLFNSEESCGKYLDLNQFYLHFRSLSGIQEAFVQADLMRVGDSSHQKMPTDYLTWLKVFFRVPEVLNLSFKSQPAYKAYLQGLSHYLTEYWRKIQPLKNLKASTEQLSQLKLQEENEFLETFEHEWESGSLFGWESAL